MGLFPGLLVSRPLACVVAAFFRSSALISISFVLIRVKLEGLEPATSYTLVVYAENGVSAISDKESPALISFTTEPAGKLQPKSLFLTV